MKGLSLRVRRYLLGIGALILILVVLHVVGRFWCQLADSEVYVLVASPAAKSPLNDLFRDHGVTNYISYSPYLQVQEKLVGESDLRHIRRVLAWSEWKCYWPKALNIRSPDEVDAIIPKDRTHSIEVTLRKHGSRWSISESVISTACLIEPNVLDRIKHFITGSWGP